MNDYTVTLYNDGKQLVFNPSSFSNAIDLVKALGEMHNGFASSASIKLSINVGA